MMADASARPSGPRPRNGSRVLHGPVSPPRLAGSGPGRRSVVPARATDLSGAALAELLISLSILTIGVLGLLSGSRATRLQARLAADRAAEALAAQQVLERRGIGISGDSVWVETIRIGVREVMVRAEVRDSFAGVAWVRVVASSGSGSAPWTLETARRTGD